MSHPTLGPFISVNSPGAEILQELEVLTIDSTVCNDRYREALQKPEGDNPIKDDMMCSGSMEGYKGTAWVRFSD